MYLTQKDSFFSLNLRGRILHLDSPIIMGILNLTPDSFYDGNSQLELTHILKKVEMMISQEASIIDIGAMSSRPFSHEISVKEEIERLQLFLPHILKEFKDTIFSIDTYRSEVAQFGLDYGVSIVNDISGGRIDPKIFDITAKYEVPYILMHMKGVPQNMQLNPNYDSILSEIHFFLSSKIAEIKTYGIHDIIIDLGFGFGKSIEDNYSLLKHLNYFHSLHCPILSGLSRKSMIYKPLNISPKDSLIGTSALHFEALRQGSKILRVHDVKEAKEVIDLFQIYQKQ